MNDRKEAEMFVKEKYAEGTMWGNAQAQRMESWLECGDDELDWECIMTDTHDDTLYWLEEMMSDADADNLVEGGIYHWMVVAYEEA
jgi:hypothetical protein